MCVGYCGLRNASESVKRVIPEAVLTLFAAGCQEGISTLRRLLFGCFRGLSWKPGQHLYNFRSPCADSSTDGNGLAVQQSRSSLRESNWHRLPRCSSKLRCLRSNLHLPDERCVRVEPHIRVGPANLTQSRLRSRPQYQYRSSRTVYLGCELWHSLLQI